MYDSSLAALFGPSQLPGPMDVPGSFLPGTMGGFAGGTFDMGGHQVSPSYQQQDADPSPVGMGAGPMPESDNEGTVKGWEPKKRSALGFLGDFLLLALGAGRAPFAERVDQKNVGRAMEGFSHDPMESIRRLSRIKGHEKEAWGLLNQQQDNDRANAAIERQNKLYDIKLEDVTRDRVASMLGAVQPGDAEGYAKMRQRALAYGNAKGYDFSGELPEDGDQLDIDGFRYGEVPVAKQIQLQDARTNRAAVLEERRGYHKTTAGISEERANEYERHNGGMENKPRAGARGSSKSPYANKAFKDPNGHLVEFNKDGSAMKVTSPDGSLSYYKMGVNGEKVLIKRLSKEEAATDK